MTTVLYARCAFSYQFFDGLYFGLHCRAASFAQKERAAFFTCVAYRRPRGDRDDGAFRCGIAADRAYSCAFGRDDRRRIRRRALLGAVSFQNAYPLGRRRASRRLRYCGVQHRGTRRRHRALYGKRLRVAPRRACGQRDFPVRFRRSRAEA